VNDEIEHDLEYRPGIPHPLPQGEQLLWQGRQRWYPLARRAFRCHAVLAYFALVYLLVAGFEVSSGTGIVAALWGAKWVVLPAAGAYAILAGIAYAFAKTTIYTVTTERLLIRSGVALPMTVDLPLKLVDAAELVRFPDGSGDLTLKLARGQRAGYFLLWPNVRPFRFRRPEPTLRALADPQGAADVVTRALKGTLEPGTRSVLSTDRPRSAVGSAPRPAGVTA